EVKRSKVYRSIKQEILKVSKEQTGELELQLALQEQAMKRHTGLLGPIRKMWDSFKETSLGRMLGGPKSLLAIGAIMFMLKKVGNFVVSSFKEVYDFIDQKVMPTNAKINQQFGNMGGSLGGLKRQAISTGVQFEYLGYSFEEGADSV